MITKRTLINLFRENAYETDEIAQISNTENTEREEVSGVEVSVNTKR
jgi:hypothetical protein